MQTTQWKTRVETEPAFGEGPLWDSNSCFQIRMLHPELSSGRCQGFTFATFLKNTSKITIRIISRK